MNLLNSVQTFTFQVDMTPAWDLPIFPVMLNGTIASVGGRVFSATFSSRAYARGRPHGAGAWVHDIAADVRVVFSTDDSVWSAVAGDEACDVHSCGFAVVHVDWR